MIKVGFLFALCSLAILLWMPLKTLFIIYFCEERDQVLDMLISNIFICSSTRQPGERICMSCDFSVLFFIGLLSFREVRLLLCHTVHGMGQASMKQREWNIFLMRINVCFSVMLVTKPSFIT